MFKKMFSGFSYLVLIAGGFALGWYDADCRLSPASKPVEAGVARVPLSSRMADFENAMTAFLRVGNGPDAFQRFQVEAAGHHLAEELIRSSALFPEARGDKLCGVAREVRRTVKEITDYQTDAHACSYLLVQIREAVDGDAAWTARETARTEKAEAEYAARLARQPKGEGKSAAK